MYNRDNLFPPPPENNPKSLCVPTGNNPGDVTWVGGCPSGTVGLGYKASDTTGRSSGSITLPYEKIFINDANNNNQQAKRVSVSAYFSIGDGPFSHIAPACIQYINAGEISAATPGKCNEACSQSVDCESGLTCSSGSCKNAACTQETDCICPAAATDMVCASYFRTADTDRMIQGTWTDNLQSISSISPCLYYMQVNILNKPYCAQPGATYITIVLIDKNKHSFDMPEIDMATEFVHSQFCPIPGEVSGLTIKFRQQGVTIPADDTVWVRLRKDGDIVHDFDWQPASSDNVGDWTVNLTTDKDGNSVSPGTYTVLIKGRSHLQKKFTNVTLTAGSNSKEWITNKRDELRAGDVNGDNKITGIDIAKVLSFYIQGGFYIPITEESRYSDINKDLHISIQDVSLIAVNWTELTIEGDQ